VNGKTYELFRFTHPDGSAKEWGYAAMGSDSGLYEVRWGKAGRLVQNQLGLTRDICAAAFFADASGPGSAPGGLTQRDFWANTGEIGSPRHPFENYSQQPCPADSRARRRRVGSLAGRGSR
jgi:hypothetical protein